MSKKKVKRLIREAIVNTHSDKIFKDCELLHEGVTDIYESLMDGDSENVLLAIKSINVIINDLKDLADEV